MSERGNPTRILTILVILALAATCTFLVLPLGEAHADDAPANVPHSATGTCYIGETWMIGEQSFFTIPSFTGLLEGAVPSSTFECLNHTAAAPENVDASYEAQLSDYSIEEGWVEYYVTITPPDATDGETSNELGLVGYQRVGGSVRLTWEFPGGISLAKRSSQPALTDENACYTLQGAVYGIFETQEDARTRDVSRAIRSVATGEDGTWSTGMDMPAGTYFIAETTPPSGFTLDPNVHSVTVSPNVVSVVNADRGYVEDAPITNPMTVWVAKRDADTTTGAPQGLGTLEGAQFRVSYYDGYYDAESLPDSPTRTWHVVAGSDGRALVDDEHIVGGDELYRLPDGRVTIPLGTIAVAETSAPEGYLPDEGVRIAQISADGTSELIDAYEAPTIGNKVARGDISFTKTDDVGSVRLGNVPFMVTSQTTGESHVVVTDENGMISTSANWNGHSENTNANDAAVIETETGYEVDESLLDPTAGVWFYGRTDATCAVDDKRGALPYDTYEVCELRAKGNEGYDLVSFTVRITRDGSILDLGTIADQSTPPDEPEPKTPENKTPKDESPSKDEGSTTTKTGDNLTNMMFVLLPACLIGLVGAAFAIRQVREKSRITVKRGNPRS